MCEISADNCVSPAPELVPNSKKSVHTRVRATFLIFALGTMFLSLILSVLRMMGTIGYRDMGMIGIVSLLSILAVSIETTGVLPKPSMDDHQVAPGDEKKYSDWKTKKKHRKASLRKG